MANTRDGAYLELVALLLEDVLHVLINLLKQNRRQISKLPSLALYALRVQIFGVVYCDV